MNQGIGGSIPALIPVMPVGVAVNTSLYAQQRPSLAFEAPAGITSITTLHHENNGAIKPIVLAATNREAVGGARLFRPSEAKDGRCRAPACLKSLAPPTTGHDSERLKRAQKGFTLIEILVALVLFAVLMTSSFQLFDTVLDANERSRSQLQQQNQLAMAWTIIFQDIIQMRARTHRDIRGDQQHAYETTQDYLARFIRGGLPPINDVAPGGMQRIAYQFEEDTLFRLSWSVLDLAADSEPRKQTLINDLKAVAFEHLDESNNYQLDWPPETTTVAASRLMPRMIRITLTFSDDSQMTRLFPGISS